MVHRDRHIGEETVKESKEVMSLKIRTMVGSVWVGAKERSLSDHALFLELSGDITHVHIR